MNKKIVGLAFVSFLAAIAGIVISAFLIKEDVTSTAHTIFEYFPLKYGVIPSSTWEGAITLGIFITVFQVVASSVAMSDRFSMTSRGVGFMSFLAACAFDNWTDVVFRSGNLSGDLEVAIVTTLSFYTFGSEVLQGLSWLVFISTWRTALSDFMLGVARFQAGVNSIGAEWKRFQGAAHRKENKERFADSQENQPSSSIFRIPQSSHKPNQNTKPVFTPLSQVKQKEKDNIIRLPFGNGKKN